MSTPTLTPSKNAPCPCGSGIKYKKCCLSKHLAMAPPGLPIGARILQRNGESFIASEGVTDEDLNEAGRYLEENRRGPAQMIVEFSQPLIDAAGGGQAGLEQAMSMGMICWNLALCQDESAREDLVSNLIDKLPEDALVRADFRAIATQMVERHRQMFPEMHRPM